MPGKAGGMRAGGFHLNSAPKLSNEWGPPLSTDCQVGPREILLDGRAGLLVATEDYMGMASAIEKLIKDETLMEGFIKEGRIRAMEFERSRVIRRLECILEAVASGNGQASGGDH